MGMLVKATTLQLEAFSPNKRIFWATVRAVSGIGRKISLTLARCWLFIYSETGIFH